ncbi:hypothetical protein HBH56_200380 [Parastagonospora nodorum]|uniref:Uncharacterized protein n=2 Tax=Phaeosphaeria nodorum (strain SN15 / ATCC MYA-4574 / FGSC 10173) TaxID=321614 RepID=A0A7U2F991_PHANO|nr:hypothetical protein HBH56_200380 [Parastagonospora nodorum]QRD00778.1 hypothetical protein JI435_093120 [Parastagonospora nodorum SN15]KAH3925740.1 hypothetical protein HBH54_175920 [Parastagonospora nodorum]KAH3953371.1 hypothetical protein HBH53_037300 [Parastagonospora nodorum]KAH4132390.1 hypothetical protein HBH45_179630 [Parastagonospora nodorum]
MAGRYGLRDRATIKPPKRLIDEVESPPKRRKVTDAQPAVPAADPDVPVAPIVPPAPVAPVARPAPVAPIIAIVPPTPTAPTVPTAPAPPGSDHEEDIDDVHRPVRGKKYVGFVDDETPPPTPPTLPHGPMGSQWVDLPGELRTMIYPESGFKKILKPIFGSKRLERGDLFEAMVVLYVVDSGIQFTRRSEFPGVRELERDYNKAHNHQLKVFVHWDCVEQIIPFLRLVKEAVFADAAWRMEHGNTFPPPERKAPCIDAPILNYLRRTHPQGEDLVLPALEQQALENLLEIAVHGFYQTSPPTLMDPEPLIISILLPTRTEFEPAVGSEVYRLLRHPFDDPTSGIVWRWPDPRTIQYVMESAAVENPTFPAIILATVEDVALSDDFERTFSRSPPDPLIPYLVGKHDMTETEIATRRVDENGFWNYLFAKDRRIHAMRQEVYQALFG